jgi:hypothetical protein
MHDASINRRGSGCQCLAEHLATKDLRTADVAALAAKKIVLEPFELEESQKIGNALIHRRRIVEQTAARKRKPPEPRLACIAYDLQPKTNFPCISAQCPGNEQKNE